MEESQTLTIKLKPYLQEYLRCKLKDPEISNRNIIGALLNPFIEYIPKDVVIKPQTGEEYITFPIRWGSSSKKNNQRGVYVSEQNQKDFERILSLHFKDIFFSYIDDKIRYNKEIKKCILQFCMDYKISFNNITYDMLKKSYYRQKKSEKSVGKFSLSCPLIFIL